MNVKCCHCGATLHVPDSYAGRDGNCNHCQGAITLPQLPEAKARSIWDVTPDNIGAVHIDPDKPLPKPVFIPEEPARVLLTPQQMQARAKLVGCFMTFVLFSFCFGGCYAYMASLSNSPEGKARAIQSEKRKESLHAVIASQFYVERKLLSPGSAKFPWLVQGKPKGPNRWAVSSYVDSQNAMGALIRTHYSCTMVKIAEDDWRCEDLTLW